MNRVDGVVLLDWSDRSLERQIQIGAKGGGIDVNLARLELNNYRANVIPVTQFFSQQGQLNIVSRNIFCRESYLREKFVIVEELVSCNRFLTFV